MGTLKSTQVTTTDEGTYPTCQGYEYNGVLLGQPVELDGDPATYEWDDSAFPNGTCEVIDGELVVTADESEENI